MNDKFLSSRPSVDTLLSQVSEGEGDPLSESDFLARRHTFQTRSRCSVFSEEETDKLSEQKQSSRDKCKGLKGSKSSKRSDKAGDGLKTLKKAKTQGGGEKSFAKVEDERDNLVEELGESMALYEGHLESQDFQSWHKKYRKTLLSAREVLPDEIRQRMLKGQKKGDKDMIPYEKQKLGQSQSVREMVTYDLKGDLLLKAQRDLLEVNNQNSSPDFKHKRKREKKRQEEKSRHSKRNKSRSQVKKRKKQKSKKPKYSDEKNTERKEKKVEDSILNLQELALGESRKLLTQKIKKLNIRSRRETADSQGFTTDRSNHSEALTIKKKTSKCKKHLNQSQSTLKKEGQKDCGSGCAIEFSFHNNVQSDRCYLNCSDRVEVLRNYMKSLHPKQKITPADILEILSEIFPN